MCIDAADGDTAGSKDILGLSRLDISEVNNTGTGTPGYVDIGSFETYGSLDSDSDGMPDDWELFHGLDPDKMITTVILTVMACQTAGNIHMVLILLWTMEAVILIMMI